MKNKAKGLHDAQKPATIVDMKIKKALALK